MTLFFKYVYVLNIEYLTHENIPPIEIYNRLHIFYGKITIDVGRYRMSLD